MNASKLHTIRAARAADLPVLLEFEQQIIATERPMDPTLKQKQTIHYYDLAAYIDAEDVEVLVAECDGRVIGSGYGQIRARQAHYRHSHLGYIGFLYVRPEHRGQSVCQNILAALDGWFAERGILEVQLQVYSRNPAAIRAYEKAGFTPHLLTMRRSAARC